MIVRQVASVAALPLLLYATCRSRASNAALHSLTSATARLLSNKLSLDVGASNQELFARSLMAGCGQKSPSYSWVKERAAKLFVGLLMAAGTEHLHCVGAEAARM